MERKSVKEDFVWGAKNSNFNIDEWIAEYPFPDKVEANDLMQQCTGLCPCGSGADFELLIEVLEWCALDHESKGREGTYRSAAWELAAKVLDQADLIEHGSGIGWPWLTSWGEEVLEAVEKLKQEPESE